MKVKLDVRPDRTYVCWNPVSGTDKDGAPVTLARGQRVRGDHFLVGKLGAECFIEDDGRDVSELPSAERAGLAVAGREIARREQLERRVREVDEHPRRQRSRINPDTPVGELRRCTTGIVDSEWGRCRVGEIRLKSDEIVQHLPGYFSEVQLT